MHDLLLKWGDSEARFYPLRKGVWLGVIAAREVFLYDDHIRGPWCAVNVFHRGNGDTSQEALDVLRTQVTTIRDSLTGFLNWRPENA